MKNFSSNAALASAHLKANQPVETDEGRYWIEPGSYSPVPGDFSIGNGNIARRLYLFSTAGGGPVDDGASMRDKLDAEPDTHIYDDAAKAKVDGLAAAPFKGTYIDIAALTLAYPAPNNAGDYAHIDAGVGGDVILHIWDVDDELWKSQADVSGLTGAQIKALYEAEPDTNAFNDFDYNKLDFIEEDAKDDQTGAEIKALYEAEAETNAFTDSEKSKLAGLDDNHFKGVHVSIGALNSAHPSAVPGDYADVDAGIGSDVERYAWDDDDTAWIKQLGQSAVLSDAQVKTQYENNADTNAYTDTEKTKLSNIESNATADQTGAEIKAAYEGEADTNAFTDAEKTSLGTMEDNATADQTGAEIKVAYEGEANTNAYTDAEKTKLSNIEAEANKTTVGVVEATVITNTTSLTFVALDSMNVTPAAGTYLVTFSCEVTNTNNDKLQDFEMRFNGVSHAAASRENSSTGGAYANVYSSALVTLNGAEAIEMFWKTNANTASVRNRQLTYTKVST